MTDKVAALQALTPNAQWVLRGDELEWLDEVQTQPTDSAIAAKIVELQAAFDAAAYARDRQAAYPSIQDCIHALLDGGDTLTDLQTLRAAVKSANPKGQQMTTTITGATGIDNIKAATGAVLQVVTANSVTSGTTTSTDLPLQDYQQLSRLSVRQVK